MRDTTEELHVLKSPGTPLPVRLQYILIIRRGMYSEAFIFWDIW